MTCTIIETIAMDGGTKAQKALVKMGTSMAMLDFLRHAWARLDATAAVAEDKQITSLVEVALRVLLLLSKHGKSSVGSLSLICG